MPRASRLRFPSPNHALRARPPLGVRVPRRRLRPPPLAERRPCCSAGPRPARLSRHASESGTGSSARACPLAPKNPAAAKATAPVVAKAFRLIHHGNMLLTARSRRLPAFEGPSPAKTTDFAFARAAGWRSRRAAVPALSRISASFPLAILSPAAQARQPRLFASLKSSRGKTAQAIYVSVPSSVLLLAFPRRAGAAAPVALFLLAARRRPAGPPAHRRPRPVALLSCPDLPRLPLRLARAVDLVAVPPKIRGNFAMPATPKSFPPPNARSRSRPLRQRSHRDEKRL
jgi:hypothetical protein